MNKKATIIGLGNVGRAILRDLLNAKLFNAINCIDMNELALEGMIMDFQDKTTSTKIYAGGYESCKDSDIVIITAGFPQKPGETRLDLGKKNYGLMKNVCECVMDSGFNGIIVVVSNPVDILTTMVQELTGLPRHRVIGSGTVLDTGRLRYELTKIYKVSPSSIHAYVVGEHGDSEFILWDSATIAGLPLRFSLTEEAKKELRDRVANKAYEIIKRQGFTAEGIGSATCKICEAIMTDSHSIMTISGALDLGTKSVAISYPHIITSDGVIPFLDTLMGSDERALHESAKKLREFYDSLKEGE